MPTYGRSFTLANPQNSKVNAPASGGGVAGKYTKEGGFLAYYEVHNSLLEGMSVGVFNVCFGLRFANITQCFFF